MALVLWMVSVLVVLLLLVTVPPPVIDPTVWLPPFKSSAAPAASVTAVLVGNRLTVAPLLTTGTVG